MSNDRITGYQPTQDGPKGDPPTGGSHVQPPREKGVIRVSAKYFDKLVEDRFNVEKKLEGLAGRVTTVETRCGLLELDVSSLKRDRVELADRLRRIESVLLGFGTRIAVSTEACEKAWPPGRRIEDRCPVKTPGQSTQSA